MNTNKSNVDISMLEKQIEHMKYNRDICAQDIKNQRRMAIVCVAGIAIDGIVLYNIAVNMRPSSVTRFMFFTAIVVAVWAAADFTNRCSNIRQSRKNKQDFTKKLDQLNAQYNQIQSMLNSMKNIQNEK